MTMIRTSALVLTTLLVVSVAGAAGTTAVGVTNQGDSTSCTCTTVDLQSGSVDLVVLANETGASGVSTSQQVTQNDDRVQVTIDLEYDHTSVEIAGETAANGSLVLTVTQDGEVVNDSVVVNGGENEAVVFHLEPDAVRVTREDVPCERICDVDVPVGDDHQLSRDGVDPSVDVNVGGGVDVNVDVGGADSAQSAECGNASTDDGTAVTDHSSASVSVGGNELRLVSQSNDLAELTRLAEGCHDAVGEPAAGVESD